MLPRALFAGLFDDAAVFPPGNAPLDAAVAGHRRLRRGPHADLIGPLLVAPAAIPATIDLAGLADLIDGPGEDEGPTATAPLDVAIAARPGTEIAAVEAAAQLAAADSRVALTAVEIGWQPGWERADLSAPLVVIELPRGTEQALPLTEIAIAAAERPEQRFVAKFRTGATETWAWPAERELARTIQHAIAMEVALKLTGGLHHALRATAATGPEHGLLNVLAAYRLARTGRPVAAIAAVLAERDAAPLIAALADCSPATITQVRTDLPSYGCCDVREPIAELTALGVLEGDPA